MDGKLRNMTSLYLVRGGEVLCLYRVGSRVADQKYVGSAGGHFEPHELNDAKACVLREMQEELGLCESDLIGLRLRYITYRRKNDEIRQNYYYFAELKTAKQLSSSEGKLRWVPFEEVASLNMPISAKHMILHYIRFGRFNDTLYAGITQSDRTDFVPMTEFDG